MREQVEIIPLERESTDPCASHLDGVRLEDRDLDWSGEQGRGTPKWD